MYVKEKQLGGGEREEGERMRKRGGGERDEKRRIKEKEHALHPP